MLAFSLPFFFVLLFSTTTSTQPYKATDRFFLNCGSSTASNSNSDQRYWDGDEHSKFVPSNFITTSFSSTPVPLHSSHDDIPYSTARIFNTSSFTYTFPVSQGPKFLRLHFYPATYSSLNAEQSFLSVSSNGYSLLTNFSAFQALSTGARVLKEFLIHVKDAQILNVTFTPSPNSHAFINGIEILSMPEDRSWDPDNNYIHGASFGVTPCYINPIMYTTETPNYTAPDTVYQTQRSLGKVAHDLTWILPVDSGFHYMLRLHFCNIIPQYTKAGQVVFKIFINNKTAEQEADVFYWTQGSGYPVVKDYIVFVNDPDGTRSKQDLWLAVGPNDANSEVYDDAFLNGLEAFKLSTDKNLASPNPQLSSTTTPIGRTPTAKRNKKKTPYAMIIGALALLSILAFIVFRQRRRDGSSKDRSSDPCRCFSLKEVKAATDEFSDNFVIGNGGSGKVYKGSIDNATTIVAIKRLDSSSRQGFREFHTEIEMLSKLRHVQLVSLIGYCDDEGEMILVYDYMAHGTLREHLYNTDNPPLSWKTRLEICIGVAKGLHYLHSGGKRAIIHGDVKSTNILLDENFVAKLSDFGLAKLGSEDQSETQVNNTVVKGSLGYTDPEYCYTQQLTKKSDVYSFGVVLLEVLCGRPECLSKFGYVASKCLDEDGSERPAMEEVVWRLEYALQLQEDAEKTDGLVSI